jgi:predicted Zn-dependent protease
MVALCVALQACEREHIVQTPTTIVVQSGEESRETVAPDHGRLTNDPRILEPVVRVASRLIGAARRSEYGPRARALCWVIAVYDDRTLTRSFVRSNGGIVLYTGIFRLAETEAGLAALLSHELAHALAIDNAPVSPVCAETTNEPPPFVTREKELEIDKTGLLLMADAGYDPRELLWLWQRMKGESDDSDGVLIHLIYDRRMEQIAEKLPQALMRYEHAHRAPQRALSQKSAFEPRP